MTTNRTTSTTTARNAADAVVEWAGCTQAEWEAARAAEAAAVEADCAANTARWAAQAAESAR